MCPAGRPLAAGDPAESREHLPATPTEFKAVRAEQTGGPVWLEVAFSDPWGQLTSRLSCGWKTGLPPETRSSSRCSDGRGPEGAGDTGRFLASRGPRAGRSSQRVTEAALDSLGGGFSPGRRPPRAETPGSRVGPLTLLLGNSLSWRPAVLAQQPWPCAFKAAESARQEHGCGQERRVGSFPAGLRARGSGVRAQSLWFGGRGLCASTGGTGGFQAHLLPCARAAVSGRWSHDGSSPYQTR